MTDLDPAFLRARKEAVTILLSWAVCLLWTVGVSWTLGYGSGSMHIALGMPTWVTFGVVVPWVAATVFSVWYGLRCIRDE